jgi:protein-disulfide isomerase
VPPTRRPAGKRRNRGLWIALGLGGVLAAALVVASAAFRDTSGQAGSATTASVPDLDGIRQRGTVLGDPSAPATLIEYADLSCPFCAHYSTAVFPTLVDRYVRSGRLKFEFRGLAFLQPVDNSDRALRYALAAGAQHRLWNYVERVYATQGEEGTEWFTDAFARTIAEQIPGLDARMLARDAEGSVVAGQVARSSEQAGQAHVSGTPTFFLQKDSEPASPIVVSELTPEAFTAALEDALAG